MYIQGVDHVLAEVGCCGGCGAPHLQPEVSRLGLGLADRFSAGLLRSDTRLVGGPHVAVQLSLRLALPLQLAPQLVDLFLQAAELALWHRQIAVSLLLPCKRLLGSHTSEDPPRSLLLLRRGFLTVLFRWVLVSP